MCIALDPGTSEIVNLVGASLCGGIAIKDAIALVPSTPWRRCWVFGTAGEAASHRADGCLWTLGHL